MNKEELLNRLKNIESELNTLLYQDRVKLRSLIRKTKQQIKQNKSTEAIFNKLEKELDNSKRKINKRQHSLDIDYPTELPITESISKIEKELNNNQVIIICGATGSGKTTQLPKLLLNQGYGKYGRIGSTQPRRLAATSMADRVSGEVNTVCGKEVGYQVRFDDNTTEKTSLKFMTDGILLSETINDKLLLQYDSIIIDEAHERSLNIDFILGYIKNLLAKRKDLKLIISSATLNAGNFSEFFNNAPILNIEGRTYPIEDVFLPPKEDEELPSHIFRAISWISDVDDKGDILVFLPGEREIREAQDFIEGKKLFNTEVLPLFGRLTVKEQRKIFKPGSERRIILATNVAETSITIPRTHYVIDSGFARISRYDPKSQVQSLQVEQISQASAKQRRGRCGRISEGICIYLYDKETYDNAPAYTDPEICRTSLAEVILQMHILNLPSIDKFPFIDPPQRSLIKEGYKTLKEINALDKNNRLTEEGKKIGAFPIEPRFAKMISHAKKEKVIPEIIVLASFLSLQDPRQRPADNVSAAEHAHSQWFNEDSDFISIINLWNFIAENKEANISKTKLRKLCKDNFLNYRKIQEWFRLFEDIKELVKNFNWNFSYKNRIFNDFNYDLFHKSLLAGFPSNLGLKYDNNQYRSPGDKKYYIFPGSNLFSKKPKWIMSFPLVETTKLYSRNNASINPEWVEEVASHLCKYIYKNIRWEPNRGFVSAIEYVVLGGLTIHDGRRVHYGRINPAKAREIFIRDGLVTTNIKTRSKWLKIQQNKLKKIEELEEKIRRPESLLNPEAVYNHFDKLLPSNVYSTKFLERWLNKTNKKIAVGNIDEIMYPQLYDIKEEDYPDYLEFCDRRFRIKYHFAPGEDYDGIVLYSTSQDLSLIPDWGLEWLVPGWLEEKVRLLIRYLPKNYRKQCNPAQQRAREFVDLVKKEEIYKEQHLLKALSNFLEEKTNTTIPIDEFDTERLPSYLKMKVAELNDRSEIVKIHQGLPDRENFSSKVFTPNENIRKWIYTGYTKWPDLVLPKQVELDTKSSLIAYPSVVAEDNTIGVQVFTDFYEAEEKHKEGLIKLFKIENPGHEKHLKKNLNLDKKTLLSICNLYNDNSYSEDIIDGAIFFNLTDRYLVTIRDEETFEKYSEETLGKLFDTCQQFCKKLTNIISLKDQSLNLLKSPNIPSESYEDIKNQISFLLRPNFLKDKYVWTRYQKYMKAIFIRTERLINSPQKDLSKMKSIQNFQEKFNDRLNQIKNTDNAYSLLRFAILLEEYRIKTFAPELQPHEKVSDKKLNKAWEETLKDRLE